MREQLLPTKNTMPPGKNCVAVWSSGLVWEVVAGGTASPRSELVSPLTKTPHLLQPVEGSSSAPTKG